MGTTVVCSSKYLVSYMITISDRIFFKKVFFNTVKQLVNFDIPCDVMRTPGFICDWRSPCLSGEQRLLWSSQQMLAAIPPRIFSTVTYQRAKPQHPWFNALKITDWPHTSAVFTHIRPVHTMRGHLHESFYQARQNAHGIESWVKRALIPLIIRNVAPALKHTKWSILMQE